MLHLCLLDNDQASSGRRYSFFLLFLGAGQGLTNWLDGATTSDGMRFMLGLDSRRPARVDTGGHRFDVLLNRDHHAVGAPPAPPRDLPPAPAFIQIQIRNLSLGCRVYVRKCSPTCTCRYVGGDRAMFSMLQTTYEHCRWFCSW